MWRRLSSRRRTAAVASVVVLAAVAVPIVAIVVASSEGVPFATGDMLAAVGDGKIKHFDSAGRLVDTLAADASGEGGAVLVDHSSGRVLAANFTASTVEQFNATGSHVGQFGGGYDVHPEGIVRDFEGNVYVGLNDGSHGLLKFSPDGSLVARFAPALENRGIDWLDLDADQCTMLYTSEGKLIKRFDVCADEQLADFASLPISGDNRTDPTSSAYALRIRHNREVVVATSEKVFRLGPEGEVIQTYTLPRTGQLLTLNLDGDLTSFWAGDHVTGQVVKVDITSGQTLLNIETTLEPEALLGGFAIVGEFLRAEPRLHLTAGGPIVVGQEVLLTATLLNSADAGSREVTFTVTGANPQESTVTTDASGNALYRYVATEPGTDTVVARGTSGRPLAALQSNAVSVAAAAAPETVLTYSGATSGAVGQSATLAARLTDAATNQPLPGAPLRLGLQDGEQCEAITDANGLGACRIVPRGAPGTYTATAAFAGTLTAAPSTTTATFTLASQPAAPAAAAVSYTGPGSGLQGEPVTLSARVVASATGRPVVGAPVRFSVNQTDTCGAGTDVNGVATCRTRITNPPGNHPVEIRSEGDALHGPASATARLLVVPPSGPVQGGRGVVLSVTGRLLDVPAIADTGEVATDGTTRVEASASALPGPILTGAVADASVSTSPGSAEVHASLARLTIDLLPPLTSGLSITLRGVEAVARSSCADGSGGGMRIGYLAVGPVVLVANEIAVPPNTALTVPDLGGLLPPISVTLNEQELVTGRNGSNLTVNAVHVVVGTVADIVVSSVRSDVHGCTAAAARAVS